MSLTDHLLSLRTPVPYADALRHPFLISAASGSLSHERLGFWLSQDRLYAAHAYPRFIGSLISAIPYDASHKIGSPEERLNQRILDALVFSLTNVVREVNFFEETAKEWGLRIEDWKERKGTRDYTAEMARVSRSLEDGLVFLWAMEKVSKYSPISVLSYELKPFRYTWILGPPSIHSSPVLLMLPLQHPRGQHYYLCQPTGVTPSSSPSLILWLV